MNRTIEKRPSKARAAPRRPRAPAQAEVVRWFDELSAQDGETAGGKGANLGELLRSGAPVPPGFVVTAAAFRQFLEAAELRQAILDRLAALNVEDGQALKEAADDLQQQIRRASLPEEL